MTFILNSVHTLGMHVDHLVNLRTFKDVQLRHPQPALAIGHSADGPQAGGARGRKGAQVTLSENGGSC